MGPAKRDVFGHEHAQEEEAVGPREGVGIPAWGGVSAFPVPEEGMRISGGLIFRYYRGVRNSYPGPREKQGV